MTKCLLKALKAVDLHNYIDLFRLLGYDSAGALAHFHSDHFKQLHLTNDELNRFQTLLDVLQQATREGKICPHYCKSSRNQRSNRISTTIEPIQYRNATNLVKKSSQDDIQPKRSKSSIEIHRRTSSTQKLNSNGFILQRPNSVTIPTEKFSESNHFGPRALSHRATVEHVKVKSYNYGVPNQATRRNSTHRAHYQHESNAKHGSIFVSSSHNNTDVISYAKPAEIYVYARKRPLLSSESNFQDAISVPNNKNLIVTENKANLDCSPLLKKVSQKFSTEFHFDQVFASDATNRFVFEQTVQPFLSVRKRQNLTYICFGQTGSGKSHTIFGSRNTDGLLVYCTQLLLQEMTSYSKLVCSFYEIYNNQLYDLIQTNKKLFVREDSEHHVNIVGVTETVLKNLETLRSVIDEGLARRHHGRSAFNANSSRSHAIFQLTCKDHQQKSNTFRLIFIDLAGSERATDAKNNQRQTRVEGAQINSSLLALKECIRSMDLTHTHAPFRQSKLTHILRDSLVGSKTRTCLMANVSPADDCCQCSLNTLQYASRIRDISIRHRHRSMPMTNFKKNTNIEDDRTNKDKTQKTFRPATASTPVHRLISSVDQRMYVDHCEARERTGKSLNVDWQNVEDDVPLSGSGDQLQIKANLSTTREFLLNNNNNNDKPLGSFYLSRYEQEKRSKVEKDEGLSSYFPPPQTDLKKTIPIQTDQPKDYLHRLNSERNDRQWKTVPAPPFSSLRRFSDASTEPPNSTRVIPIAPAPQSDDNQYSSASGTGTVTESLGTKITKMAAGTNPLSKTNQRTTMFVENLNLNKNYDTATLTSDAEQGFYSDRQATHRDQTGFFSNRDDPYFGNPYLSEPLPTILQESSLIATPAKGTPLQSHHHHHHHHLTSDLLSTTSHRNQSQNSFSSPHKSHHRIQEASQSSSESTLSNGIRSPSPQHRGRLSPQHRIIPLQLNPPSDSEDVDVRSKSSSTVKDIHIRKNAQEQTDDRFLSYSLTQSPSPILPKQTLHAPLDQFRRLYGSSLSSSTPQRKSPEVQTDFRRRRTDLIPVTRTFGHRNAEEDLYLSPTKEHGVRVSDQLNTLRSLLETRLKEQDDVNRRAKDSSFLQSSPGTFAKDFLHSYQRSKSYDRSALDLHSDPDNDDDDDEKDDYRSSLHRNLNFDDPLTKAKSLTQTSTSSIVNDYLRTPIHLRDKKSPSSSHIHTRDERIPLTVERTSFLHSPVNGNHRPSITDSDLTEITSNPTNNSTQTSESRPTYAETGASSSRSRSSIIVPPLNTFDTTGSAYHGHDHLIDSGKGSSLLTGTSFDALMNSLRTMREKDLDFLIENNPDSLIRVNQ